MKLVCDNCGLFFEATDYDECSFQKKKVVHKEEGMLEGEFVVKEILFEVVYYCPKCQLEMEFKEVVKWK